MGPCWRSELSASVTLNAPWRVPDPPLILIYRRGMYWVTTKSARGAFTNSAINLAKSNYKLSPNKKASIKLAFNSIIKFATLTQSNYFFFSAPSPASRTNL